MRFGMKLLAFWGAFLGTSVAFGHELRCMSTHHPLITAFYYPDNTFVSSAGFNVHKVAIAHLDIFNYSSAYYGFINKDGHYELTQIAQQNLYTLAEFIKKNHLSTKVFLSLGHWSGNMHEVFLNEQARTKFIEAIIQVVKQKEYHLNGIDLDWENFFSPRKGEVAGFSHFVKQLRESLDKNNLKHVCLSLDLPASTAFAKTYPKNWVPYVDFGNVMAYEYYGDSPMHTELDATLGKVMAPYAGHTPTYPNLSISETMSYYANELNVPKNKLVLALPFYANVNYVHDADEAHNFGLRQKVIDGRSIITVDYSNVYDELGIYGKARENVSIHEYTFQQPENVKGTHAYWALKFVAESPQLGKTYKFVSYPDPISIKEITQFIQKEGYLGLSAWQLDYDLPFDNANSLLRTMYNIIH